MSATVSIRELESSARIGLSGGESIARKAVVSYCSECIDPTAKHGVRGRVQRRSDIGSMSTISRMFTVFVEVSVATEASLTLWGGVGVESRG